MKTLKAYEAQAVENPHGVDVRRLYDTPDALVSHLTLEPGQGLLRHITPVDVFFYVLEGNGTVEIGDEAMVVGRDTLVESPAEIPHRWYNDSEETLRVLVVKVPRPSAKSRLL